MIAPSTPEELVEAVRSGPRWLAVGGRTKPRLGHSDAPALSLANLQGIVEYDPSEFTFTARAGTTLREIAAALAERGQYLPFDPMLVEAGATLGGTVASGLSGPGRFRYGGLRDFILGVRFVDGLGRLLRLGGKVVKNAAGFDVPKFLVGSLGRFGILAEITFKVFPRPAATRTLQLTLDSPEAAVCVLTDAANTRWEPEAIDLLPDGRTVLLRLSAPEPALEAITGEIGARWPARTLSSEEAASRWRETGEFGWSHAGEVLLKAGITPDAIGPLHHALGSLPQAKAHFSSGGSVAFLSAPVGTEIDPILTNLGLCALTLRGEGPLWRGRRIASKIEKAVKQALDPDSRFPDMEA